MMAFGDLMPAAALSAMLRQPKQEGVYGLFLWEGERILEVAGYFRQQTLRPTAVGRHHLLYAGQADDVARRLKSHLNGDAWVSTFRRSLLALEATSGAVSRANLGWNGSVAAELMLTTWLRAHALLWVQPCEDRREREREILAREASPLNIKLRESSAFAKSLAVRRMRAFPQLYNSQIKL